MTYVPKRVALACVGSLLAAGSGCSGDAGGVASAGHEDVGVTSEALTVKCGASANGPVQGRDVSTYQGAFDWAAAKAGGVVFGYARISDGLGGIDNRFAGNWSSMKALNVMRGGYQFFEPGEDEVAQANVVVKAVGKLGNGDLPVMADVEAAGGQAPATVAAKLRHWLQIVEAGTGKRPWIYTGAYFWQDHVGDTTFGQYPLVIAAYGPVCPTIPNGWSNWTAWQYSDGNGTLDHDVFNGSLAALQAFATGEAAPTFPAIKRRSNTDVNGDGTSDVCGRSKDGVVCDLLGPAKAAEIKGPAWTDAAWGDASTSTTVQFADVNGDGKADVCGRGVGGFTCQLSDGNAFPTTIAGPAWSDKEGWNSPEYYSTLQLPDVNGDAKADACGRGYLGIECWLSDGQGFPTAVKGPLWSDPTSWNMPEYYATIQYADVNGDGKDDVCGRNATGVLCYLSDGSGFPTKVDGPAWSDAKGWSVPATGSTLRFVDLNGDKKADLCGRGADGLHCVLSKGDGFDAEIVGPAWSDAAGWAKPEHYTTIVYGDVNGDGRADVCGRDASAFVCHTFDGSAFGAAIPGPTWTDAQGWNKPQQYTTIGMADVNHDGKDDLCGRAATGIVCAPSNGAGFGASIDGPAWSDAAGWGAPQYFGSVRYVGAAVKTDGAGAAPSGPATPPPGGSPTASEDSGDDDGCGVARRAHARFDGGAFFVSLGLALSAAIARRRAKR